MEASDTSGNNEEINKEEARRIRRREISRNYRLRHPDRVKEQKKRHMAKPEAKKKHAEQQARRRARIPERCKEIQNNSYKRNRPKRQTKEWRDKANAYQREWAASNPEKRKEIRQRYFAKPGNREKSREYGRMRQKLFPEKLRAATAKYLANNSAKVKEARRLWGIANRHKLAAAGQRRRALQLQQLHPDNDRAKEREIYALRDAMIREHGTKFHVDHIIPLHKGGWHHHLNLQVLPGSMNISKKADEFWEKAGFLSWRDVPRHLWPEKLVPQYLAILDREDAAQEKLITLLAA